MKPINYHEPGRFMIVYEIDNQGFIIEFVESTFCKIRDVVEKWYGSLADYRPWLIPHEPQYDLKNAIATYTIYGNKNSAGKMAAGSSNGHDYVYAVKIEDGFCLRSFIMERQNCRTLFDPFAGEVEDAKLTDFVLKFEYHVLYSN